MQYWNGTEWVTVAAGNEGQILMFIGGVPTWKSTSGLTIATSTDVYNPTTGKLWMDRNLGASQVATSSIDDSSYGDLYQWGRSSDGHQSRTSGMTEATSLTDTPGHANFINGTTNWRSTQNDNLWQGVNGVNNPCPTGYRLPTATELQAEINTWDSQDAAGAFASPLKLTKAGNRLFFAGGVGNLGYTGSYWTSNVSGSNSQCMNISDNAAVISSAVRATGYSVRCIKN